MGDAVEKNQAERRDKMLQLLNIGDEPNINIREYYLEDESELKQIVGAPTGSIALILSKYNGLSIRMLHSTGEWMEI